MPEPAKRPNIVFILTDDQGPWALGCAGNPEIRTPNLDRLAAEGMRFTRFFCTSPVCSPARASLMTGRIPSQHGVHDWIRGGNAREHGAIEYLRGQPGYTDFLAEAGYVCGMSGKWHLGDSIRPQKGFSHWYVHVRGGGPYYGAPMYRGGRLIEEPGYVTDAITDDALAFIEAHAGGPAPFYASVHYTAPHSPWIDNHPEDLVASYDDCPFASCPVEERHPWTLPQTVPPDVRERRREHLKGYFAAVTAVDASVGRIVARLEELGVAKDTLLCFTSDNGFNCGHHGVWGKGNGTFPLNMYDTSVLVPMLAWRPGVLPAGAVCDAMLSQYDFMPTLLDYVGLDNPGAQDLPGRSFAPLLRGEPMPERENVVVFDEYGPVRMIRSRAYKYVHRYPYGPHEFYDLEADPEERVNRIGDPGCGAAVGALKAELDAWFARYADPARDGVREAVTGRGQLDWAGPAGRGRKAFARETE